MTEYYVEKFYDEYALKKEETIIAVIDTGTNARKVCDLLNEQDERIEAMENEFIKDLELMYNDCMKCEKEYEERIRELENELELYRYYVEFVPINDDME